ncbi:ubiquinol-cytochrome C chaperone family protein [Pannonibacter sp. Pt2]|uniref:Ubiquinol-cytochrome C chaperone family protein n=1 Tax=Pannonibacter anstelovis TaxID=3121537 RepID=A0ABU7ZPR6_9HYPH
MVFGLFRRRTRPSEYALYGAIVAQARQPAFYAALSVPDTVDGRFDMMILHAVLLFRRLQGEGKEAAATSQAVFDLFFRDMDASLREMGISDNRVPKKVRKMAEAFYGRANAYGEALDAGNAAALAAAIGRNIFTETPNAPACDRLALYMMDAVKTLADLPLDGIMTAKLAWPDVPALEGNPNHE